MLQENRAPQRRLSGWKSAAAAFLSLPPLLLFFLPVMTYQIDRALYPVSGINMFVSRLSVRGYLIGFPFIMPLALALCAALALAGGVLVLKKKAPAAAACHILSALCPIVLLLSSGEVTKAAASLGASGFAVTYHWVFVLALVSGVAASLLDMATLGSERLAESVFRVFACLSVGSVAAITLYMIFSGVPAIAEIGLTNFLFGTEWKPTAEPPSFGILNMILATVLGTVGAVLIGVPIGLLTAVFLSEVAPRRLAGVVRPAIELLAGIPSVIYGFFGMLVIVPAIRAAFPNRSIGESLLAVMLILSIMVLPTIVSVSENALQAVPVSYREASLGLGATPVSTIFRVTVPAARSGILAGVILGVGRAVGETMAVVMVAGNMVQFPTLLGTVRPMTAGIVMEMSYASGLHRQALFAIGLILFLFIMVVNISFTVISRKGAKKLGQ